MPGYTPRSLMMQLLRSPPGGEDSLYVQQVSVQKISSGRTLNFPVWLITVYILATRGHCKVKTTSYGINELGPVPLCLPVASQLLSHKQKYSPAFP